jgi:fermentation-respiration switch protein FrsA (DUF1100 family)
MLALRSLITAILAALLLAAPASAEADKPVREPAHLTFGPDGSLLALSGYFSRPGSQRTRRGWLYSSACSRAAVPAQCVVEFETQGDGITATWRSDGRALYLQTGGRWIRFRRTSGDWRTEANGKISLDLPGLPPILSVDAFERLSTLRADAPPPVDLADPLVGRDGSTIVWWLDRSILDARTGRTFAPPPHAFDYTMLGELLRPIAINLVGQENRIESWAANMGENGQLVTITPASQMIREPKGQGPWRPVRDFTGAVRGFHSLDKVQGLAPGVARPVLRERQRRPSFDIITMALGPRDRQTAVMLRDANGGWALLRCTDHNCRPVMEEKAARTSVVTAEALTLPGPLPARLYRTAAARRGVVIYFEGGPGVSLDQVHPQPIHFFSSQGFDVLVVAYRGSSGHGAEHYLALTGDVAAIAHADLSVAKGWARTQGGTLGFFGSSFGGLAGIVEAMRGGTGLDFVVLDSPLIAMRPRDCQGHLARIYGTVGAGNDCKLAPLKLPDPWTPASVPIFLLTGDKDIATPAATALSWSKAYEAAGGCLTTLWSKTGGHAVFGWPDPDRTEAERTLAIWLAGPSCAEGVRAL